jgi:signal transduction histidine kinase
MVRLGENALHVLERRYLLRDEAGQVIETPSAMFRRVAQAVAAAEHPPARALWAERFEARMAALELLPNSPTLMNAGRAHGQLAACFVLPVDDDLAAIFDALKWAALIHQSGGGTGFSFSRLRPRGDVVKTTHGVASGPVSFMRVYDAATEIIKQGGVRRGANMAVLAADHPDVLEFVDAKRAAGLENFNISVAAPDALFHAAARGGRWALRHPRGGAVVRELDAAELLQRIAASAWASGEPGLVFLDRVEAANPTPDLGRFEAVNPCGEQPLLPFEACTLGSVNLARFERGGRVDYDRLGGCVREGVRLLDDVLDVNVWPLPQIAEISRRNRKIGLGVMGWADLLVALGIPYDAPEALALAEELARRLAIALDNARLYGEAERAVRARDEFLAIASHELKGPLGPLQLRIAMLERLIARGELRAMPHEKLVQIFGGARGQVHRLASLVDDLLDVTRLSTHRFRLDVAPMDLAAAVRDVVEQHLAEAAAAGVALRVEAPPSVLGAWDRRRIDQVLENLVGNALKYAPGAPVEVRVEADAASARIRVHDEGPGIPPADQERVFRAFERACPSAGVAGLGVGLYVVREIVRAHGGAVTLESEPGHGTTFTVTLPRGRPATA